MRFVKESIFIVHKWIVHPSGVRFFDFYFGHARKASKRVSSIGTCLNDVKASLSFMLVTMSVG